MPSALFKPHRRPTATLVLTGVSSKTPVVASGRVAVQEASIKARKRKAAASARAAVSKAARDEKQDEVKTAATRLI